MEVSDSAVGGVLAAIVATAGAIGGALISKMRTPLTSDEVADDVVNRALLLVRSLQADNDRLRTALNEAEAKLYDNDRDDGVDEQPHDASPVR